MRGGQYSLNVAYLLSMEPCLQSHLFINPQASIRIKLFNSNTFPRLSMSFNFANTELWPEGHPGGRSSFGQRSRRYDGPDPSAEEDYPDDTDGGYRYDILLSCFTVSNIAEGL